MKPLVIYHGNCADGFTAAWVANKFFRGECDLFAGTYQNPPPEIEPGRIVVLVDFSYKRSVMLELSKRANGILVLDHHKSAAEDLVPGAEPWIFIPFQDYSGQVDWPRFMENVGIDGFENSPGRIYTYFDMNRSGAGIAWDFFFPGLARPQLINHVEDRDLWRFNLPFTREIQACVFSYPYDLAVWDELMAADPTRLVTEGTAIERKHHKDIAELVRVVTRRMTIAGHSVPVANLPYTLTSDAGHLLAKGEPFAACYWDTPEGRVFSLRSTEDGLDVSEIAKQYGGGGHRNASGFRVPHDRAAEFERAA